MFLVHRRCLLAVSSREGRGRGALASSKDTQPTDKGSVLGTSGPFPLTPSHHTGLQGLHAHSRSHVLACLCVSV